MKLPNLTYGTWQTDKEGYLNAIFPREKQNKKCFAIGFGSYGTEETIPKSVISWDDFVSLSKEVQTKIYQSLNIAVEPPDEYVIELISLIDAFTKPFEQKSNSCYERFKSNFSTENFQKYNPEKIDYDINKKSIQDIIPKKQIDVGSIESNTVYFTVPGHVTVFGQQSNNHIQNIILSIPKIRMINLDEYKILPFSMQKNMNEREISRLRTNNNIWIQNNRKNTIDKIEYVKLFNTLSSNNL